MFKSMKGQYGYFRSEKKRRALVTFGFFAIPILILISGILYTGSKKNFLTVIAMVGFIPAAMSMVSFIVIMMRTSISRELYDAIDPHIGSLTYAYELYLTSEKQNALVDCLVFCGNEVVGLVTDPHTDPRFAKDHLQKYLRADGYKVSVYMLTDVRHFVERCDSLNAHADELRAGIAFKEDPRFPGYDREDMIRHTALNLSI